MSACKSLEKFDSLVSVVSSLDPFQQKDKEKFVILRIMKLKNNECKSKKNPIPCNNFFLVLLHNLRET